MPLIHESHDSLPYIDAPLTSTTHAAAAALIAAELSPSATSIPHPSLPPSPPSSYPPLLAAEHARLASSTPKDPTSGIDLTRYEALDPSALPSSSSETAALHTLLRRAYTASTHLTARGANLSLLERFGKTAWLVSNAQLEALLRDAEAELAETRASVEAVEAARRDAQLGSAGPEMALLEEGWRAGVKRVVETEAAAEGLRREILERRRALAAAGAAAQ